MSAISTQQAAYAPRAGAAEQARTRRAGDAGPAGTSRPERLRAHAALIALWAGLALAILAYAISRESIATLALGTGAIWLLRTARTAAFRDAGDEPTPITFR